MSRQFYRRCLPHWQIPEATYFITYRLAGSIPIRVIRQIQNLYLEEVEIAKEEAYNVTRNSVPGFDVVRRNSVPTRDSWELCSEEWDSSERSSEAHDSSKQSSEARRILATILKRKRYDAYKRQFKRWDDFLDTNLLNEPHWLKQEPLAQLNIDAIHFYNGKRYQVLAFCIMANHIHLLINLLPGAPVLHKVLQDLKKYTAVQGNRLLGRTGRFWETESYDHIVRDGEFDRILAYILNNPVKAGLVQDWEDWRWSYCHPMFR